MSKFATISTFPTNNETMTNHFEVEARRRKCQRSTGGVAHFHDFLELAEVINFLFSLVDIPTDTCSRVLSSNSFMPLAGWLASRMVWFGKFVKLFCTKLQSFFLLASVAESQKRRDVSYIWHMNLVLRAGFARLTFW